MMQATLFNHVLGQVKFQPNIGLDANVRKTVVDILNLLLADEAVLLLKMHYSNKHANKISSSEVLSLYETQSKQINTICNEIKERIQILGGPYIKDIEGLINSSRLDGKTKTTPGIVNILADHEAFIRFLREDTQTCSDIYEDQGTFALLVKMISTHEKMAWMLRSSIEPELS